ncbi:MAG: dihydroorotate dehydrogenase [Clostridiaceae bacterium]|nr:dihydroorotate dehydrogenase [Clostridiaceae bacterium]
MCDMKVEFANIKFSNPVVAASGTFGFGEEYHEIYDVGGLGGISSKGLTLSKKSGNIGLRICETPMGLINSIGLENPGVEDFIVNELPKMKSYNNRTIINIGGSTEEEYIAAVERFNDVDIDMIELNISCPNVKEGCMAFGIHEDSAGRLVKKVKQITRHPLIVKLSPNAENIVKVACACEDAGADGLSLINTIKAMAIDINNRKPVFENIYAGLSGPAIKPIALRMVHEVCNSVKIPVMGMGGIMNWQDAIEFIMAGAHLVQIGTVNFVNPEAGKEIISGIEAFMKTEGIKSLDEIRGII